MAPSAKDLPTAPVAVLMFNRPDVTARVMERIFDARPSALYLVADGPRPGHPEDRALCEETRARALDFDWDCPVYTNFADTNLGLKSRVGSGLDWVFDQTEQAIVIEDDCLAEPSFFRFATELLHRYADDERVGIVSGNNFLRGEELDQNSYYFSTDSRIWGWATWSRVWKDFSETGLDREWGESEVRELCATLDSPVRRKTLYVTAKNISQLDTWDVAFVLNNLRRGYLNAMPAKNLVTNLGFGVESTHTKFESFTAEIPLASLDFPLRHPSQLSAHPSAGRVEARAHRLMWLRFPLTHPFDFAGRVWRYLSWWLRSRS